MHVFMGSAAYAFTQSSGHEVLVENTNDALRSYQGDSAYRIVAGKTGYLPEAGYVLASTVESRGKRVQVIVMGSDSKELRSIEMRGLAEWAFRVFRWPSEV
jgi:D-alanyl-D-alanine carboxypeptidase